MFSFFTIGHMPGNWQITGHFMLIQHKPAQYVLDDEYVI